TPPFARRTGVRPPNERLLGLLVEAGLLETPVERLRRELQELHGAPLVALGVLERAHDLPPLQLLDRLLQRTGRSVWPGHGGRRRRTGLQVLRQVDGAHDAAVHQADRALDDLLQLA